MSKEKVLLEKCECGNMVHDDAPACFQCGKMKSRRIYNLHKLSSIVYMLTVPFISFFVLVVVFKVHEDTASETSLWLFVAGVVWLFVTMSLESKKFDSHPYARRNN